MREDYLAELLRRSDLDTGVLLAGIAVALMFGAIHALEPGHGKTLVAAYLVGSRGTLRHAALLGASVTVTHTASVFLVGIGTLFVSAYVVPEKIIPALGVVSGLSIVAIGGWLFRKRYRALRHSHHHGHGHAHHHHGHDHPPTHTHAPPDEASVGSLMALGASGGLVPCPSAMVLMLSSIALGRTGLGLVLLVAFSLGLAGVLVATGALVLYAKRWIPGAQGHARKPVLRLVPVLSAGVIVCIGMVMTAASLGWVRLGGLT
jgi:ABC-type nickel/cobalt efflux system permease component RcnA